MTRALVIVHACDVCDEQFVPEENGKAVEYTFSGEKMEVDLCADHKAIWLNLLRVSRVVKSKKSSGSSKHKPVSCEICGKEYRGSSGLSYHLKTAHPEQEEDE